MCLCVVQKFQQKQSCHKIYDMIMIIRYEGWSVWLYGLVHGPDMNKSWLGFIRHLALRRLKEAAAPPPASALEPYLPSTVCTIQTCIDRQGSTIQNAHHGSRDCLRRPAAHSGGADEGEGRGNHSVRLAQIYRKGLSDKAPYRGADHLQNREVRGAAEGLDGGVPCLRAGDERFHSRRKIF